MIESDLSLADKSLVSVEPSMYDGSRIARRSRRLWRSLRHNSCASRATRVSSRRFGVLSVCRLRRNARNAKKKGEKRTRNGSGRRFGVLRMHEVAQSVIVVRQNDADRCVNKGRRRHDRRSLVYNTSRHQTGWSSPSVLLVGRGGYSFSTAWTQKVEGGRDASGCNQGWKAFTCLLLRLRPMRSMLGCCTPRNRRTRGWRRRPRRCLRASAHRG